MLAKKLQKAQEKIEELNFTIQSLKQLDDENDSVNKHFEWDRFMLNL
jgi:hypothetical protein